MKHKAQESWEMIQKDDYEYDNGMGIIYDYKSFDKDCDTIQDLIICQLTVEEIEHILLTLSCNPIDDVDKNIFKKLEKQKEMWVSDDDY